MTGHQWKHLGLQIIRRGVQVSVMVLVVGVAVLSLYAHYRAARALEDNPELTGWKAVAFSQIDQRVSEMDDAQAFLDGNKGTLWSMRLGGVDLSDPLAAVEMTAASRATYGTMLISIIIPVVATLLLGRVFCSWICPANVLFEVTGKLRKLLRFAEVPPAEVKFSHNNKYVFLGVGVLMALVVGLPIFALLYPPALLSRLAHAWVFGTALTGMLVLIGLIVVFELLVSPRWWCRTMCPGGALYGVLGWSRLLRVKLDPAKCTGCRECEPVCEPGLDPVRESYGIECDNCGVCIRHCPDRALFYTIGLPGGGNGRWAIPSARIAEGRRRPGREPEGTGSPNGGSPVTAAKNDRKLTVLKSMAILLVLLPAPAAAHHILGLPHYSYKENYPQAPTLEYPATTGPYDVLLTSYPGKPVPGESANLSFYIKDRNTKAPYDQPINVRVLQTFTFGRNREILPATETPPFDNTYRISATFPDDGEYIIELTMDVEGQTEVIPFLMIAGQPSATLSVVLAVVGGLGVFVIVIRAIKIKRRRRLAGERALSLGESAGELADESHPPGRTGAMVGESS
ncbi:MAG: 4Fe-4S binding protein [bacterium]|nr:4Fe-4S binding protein [bacterium]